MFPNERKMSHADFCTDDDHIYICQCAVEMYMFPIWHSPKIILTNVYLHSFLLQPKITKTCTYKLQQFQKLAISAWSVVIIPHDENVCNTQCKNVVQGLFAYFLFAGLSSLLFFFLDFDIAAFLTRFFFTVFFLFLLVFFFLSSSSLSELELDDDELDDELSELSLESELELDDDELLELDDSTGFFLLLAVVQHI